MAGAIADASGRILVTRRPDQVHQGGRWEFPGGKLEPGEDPEQVSLGSCRKSLEVRVLATQPLIRIHHEYADRHILLDVRRVSRYEGVPLGLEGQPLAWLHPEAMDAEVFPGADRPIIAALRLPQLLLITGPDPRFPESFLSCLEAALVGGIRLVQLRAHELESAAYRDLAEEAFALCEATGARLLLNRDLHEVEGVPRHGIHLRAGTLATLGQRPGPPQDLVGASCHDAVELTRAATLGLDYALLSPVRATASHPELAPLGWTRFAALVDSASLPVFALGGLSARDLGDALRHGAQGIAAIRGLWPESGGHG